MSEFSTVVSKPSDAQVYAAIVAQMRNAAAVAPPKWRAYPGRTKIFGSLDKDGYFARLEAAQRGDEYQWKRAKNHEAEIREKARNLVKREMLLKKSREARERTFMRSVSLGDPMALKKLSNRIAQQQNAAAPPSGKSRGEGDGRNDVPSGAAADTGEKSSQNPALAAFRAKLVGINETGALATNGDAQKRSSESMFVAAAASSASTPALNDPRFVGAAYTAEENRVVTHCSDTQHCADVIVSGPRANSARVRAATDDAAFVSQRTIFPTFGSVGDASPTTTGRNYARQQFNLMSSELPRTVVDAKGPSPTHRRRSRIQQVTSCTTTTAAGRSTKRTIGGMMTARNYGIGGVRRPVCYSARTQSSKDGDAADVPSKNEAAAEAQVKSWPIVDHHFENGKPWETQTGSYNSTQPDGLDAEDFLLDDRPPIMSGNYDFAAIAQMEESSSDDEGAMAIARQAQQDVYRVPVPSKNQRPQSGRSDNVRPVEPTAPTQPNSARRPHTARSARIVAPGLVAEHCVPSQQPGGVKSRGTSAGTRASQPATRPGTARLSASGDTCVQSGSRIRSRWYSDEPFGSEEQVSTDKAFAGFPV